MDAHPLAARTSILPIWGFHITAWNGLGDSRFFRLSSVNHFSSKRLALHVVRSHHQVMGIEAEIRFGIGN
jgi:hypothetical protein